MNQRKPEEWSCQTHLCDNLRESWTPLLYRSSRQILARELRDRSSRHGTPLDRFEERARDASLCLAQAKSYYDAALLCPMQVRPDLLYYSGYSVAVCLILCLSESAPSLHEARRTVGMNHGLRLVRKGRRKLSLPDHGLESSDILSQLRCYPSTSGTFPRLCDVAQYDFLSMPAEMPVELGGSGYPDRYLVDGFPRYPDQQAWQGLQLNGLSLLQLLSWIPDVGDILQLAGIPPSMMGGVCRAGRQHSLQAPGLMLTCYCHNQLEADRFEEKCQSLEWQTLRVADHIVIADVPISEKQPYHPFPAAIENIVGQSWFFIDEEPSLSELPTILATLYVLSMLVRYCPDFWTRLLHEHEDLFRLFERFCDVVTYRLPNLALNHITGCLHYFTTSL